MPLLNQRAGAKRIISSRGRSSLADIGGDRMMWGADYPHSESTFPRSREVLDSILQYVPEEERAKIVCHNTAALYGFDLARISQPPAEHRGAAE